MPVLLRQRALHPLAGIVKNLGVEFCSGILAIALQIGLPLYVLFHSAYFFKCVGGAGCLPKSSFAGAQQVHIIDHVVNSLYELADDRYQYTSIILNCIISTFGTGLKPLKGIPVTIIVASGGKLVTTAVEVCVVLMHGCLHQ